MEITLYEARKSFTFAIFCLNNQELQILQAILVGSTVAGKYFSCMRDNDNWIRNCVMTDLLCDLAIRTVHGHTILILKTDMMG